MLVTFTTQGSADIVMFGDIARVLLKMMGHSATVPGAILADDVPAALNRLTAAIDKSKAPPTQEKKDQEEPGISMAHRALPLINLLKDASKANSNVMWN
jgi:hypothetical protein